MGRKFRHLSVFGLPLIFERNWTREQLAEILDSATDLYQGTTFQAAENLVLATDSYQGTTLVVP